MSRQAEFRDIVRTDKDQTRRRGVTYLSEVEHSLPRAELSKEDRIRVPIVVSLFFGFLAFPKVSSILRVELTA